MAGWENASAGSRSDVFGEEKSQLEVCCFTSLENSHNLVAGCSPDGDPTKLARLLFHGRTRDHEANELLRLKGFAIFFEESKSIDVGWFYCRMECKN